MKRRNLVLALSLAAAATGVLWSAQAVGSKSGNRIEPFRPMVLDGVVRLHEHLRMQAAVFLSPIVLDPGNRKPSRVISVTVNWQCGLDLLTQASLFRMMDPSSAEPIYTQGTVNPSVSDPLPQDPAPDAMYAMQVEPRTGLTWGQVQASEDLVFDAFPIESSNSAGGR